MVLTLNPLLPRLWWFKKLGGFERGLFERWKREFRSAQLFESAQGSRRPWQGVSFTLVTFFLDKQKKVTRLEAKNNVYDKCRTSLH